MRTSRPAGSITDLRAEIVSLALLRSMTRPTARPTAWATFYSAIAPPGRPWRPQETHVFSASLLNSLRFGLNREGVQDNLSAQALNPAAADPSLGAIPGEPASHVSVGGITDFMGGAEDATRFPVDFVSTLR